MPKWARFRECL